MNRSKTLATLALTVLFLAACGTSGGLGDILGGNQGSRQELRGTVQSVDTSSRSIFLTDVSGGDRSMLSNSGGSIRVYYDTDTTVSFNGQNYRPEDLERGDEVSVVASSDGSTLTADSMTVLRDVSTGTTSGSYPSSSYGTTIRGSVAYVDTSRRTIEIDPFSSGSNVIVEFDNNTPVYYNNQTFRATDLERGDEVEIRYRDLGSNRVLAQDITVTRNAGSNGGTFGGSTSNQMSTVRGTVRYVDTSRRTIDLESASWISGFQSGGGTGNRYTISYDSNMRIDVNGALQPVNGLEVGDVIEVQVSNTSGSMLQASRMWLVRDVRR